VRSSGTRTSIATGTPTAAKAASSADLVQGEAGAGERGHLGRDLLGDAAAAAGLEHGHGAVGVRRGRRRAVGEERLAQVDEGG
jgi:hypothetical protein